METPDQSKIVLKEGRVYHLGIPPGELAPNLVFTGDPQRAYKVAQSFDQKPREFRNREFITLCGSYQGIPCSMIGTGIGTDNVEIALVEAYALLCTDLGMGTPEYTP